MNKQDIVKIIKEELSAVLEAGEHTDKAINPKGGYLTTIPNTAQGKRDLEALKRILSSEYTIKLRGRNPDRKGTVGADEYDKSKYHTKSFFQKLAGEPPEVVKWGPSKYQQDFPIAKSTSWAVYLYPKQKITKPENIIDIPNQEKV